MEGALHGDHFTGISHVLGFVWDFGLEAWNGLIPHSFQISLCFLLDHVIPALALGRVLASAG
jgi:hypothetical protein